MDLLQHVRTAAADFPDGTYEWARICGKTIWAFIVNTDKIHNIRDSFYAGQ